MSRGLRSHLSPALIAGLVAAGAVGLCTTEASAQGFANRLALRAEFAAGTMVSSHQRAGDADRGLGYDGVGIEATVRLGITLFDPLTLNIGLANWFFPSSLPAPNDGTGRVLAPMGGLRFEPKIGRLGRLFIEANAGVAFTGTDPATGDANTRFTFDAGLGFEFQVARAFAIGPVLRYGHVVSSTTDFADAAGNVLDERFKDDAQYIAGGLSLSLRVPEPETPTQAAPSDTDNDGVMDPDDQCPTTPQGEHPDPERRGCPLSDADSDGVYDNEDLCPTQPQGARPDPARRGCPMGDQDSDGVFDHEDQCPTTPQGTRPDPNRRGCPVGDRDHDGITDDADRCPDQPETFNGRDDTDGCPDGREMASISNGQINIVEQVRFRTNRADIQGRRSNEILDSVVAILNAHPEITNVDIQGHTDDKGNAERNRGLSRDRANTVLQYLTAHGIAASRLQAHGFGPDRPLVQGRSRRARAANRRVEFHITVGNQ
jgi:outer membrane protein OmpA-like peptidoglycan-associated protein